VAEAVRDHDRATLLEGQEGQEGAEVHYCVHAAHRLGYISDEVHAELETDLNSVGAPLSGLVRSTRLLPAVISGFTLLGGILIGSRLW
jgi:sulfur relay (sulfurtransferase) complex TusBCD TusD component (DsrE family)